MSSVAGVGHNGGPIDTPFDALKLHMDDLLTEASNWADGTPVATEAQAEALAALREQLKLAEKDADAARKEERKPFDDEIDAIQARWNEYIAPAKNKRPGKIPKALLAVNNLLGAWLGKKADEQRAEEERRRAEAERLAQEALAARKAVESATDIAAIDEAEALIEAAAAAARDAERLSKTKAQVKGDGQARATGLRTRLIAVFNEGEGGKALSHYAKAHPKEVLAFLQTLADRDASAGVRHIPGFMVKEERYVP